MEEYCCTKTGRLVFSIVIPTFNSERYLVETLQSIRVQEFDSLEVIVVDGGSTDRTLEIIEEFRDTVDIILNGPDSGQAEALNKGFRIARGEFFLWVNGDDLLHPEALVTVYDYIRKNPAVDWYNLGTVIIDDSGGIVRFHSAPPWNGLVNKRYRPQVSSPTTIFRRDLFYKAGWFDERFHYAMDVDMWRRFVEVGARWVRIPIFAFFFRRHVASKTNSGFAGSTDSQIKEAALMSEKHKYNIDGWHYIMVDKIWRLVTCEIFDRLTASRWFGKSCRDFMYRR